MNNEVLFLYIGCNQPIFVGYVDGKYVGGIPGIQIDGIDDMEKCGELPARPEVARPLAGPSSDPVAGPSSGRISNSNPSDVHYPWVVMVSRTFTFNTEGATPYNMKCGGTIINHR